MPKKEEHWLGGKGAAEVGQGQSPWEGGARGGGGVSPPGTYENQLFQRVREPFLAYIFLKNVIPRMACISDRYSNKS